MIEVKESVIIEHPPEKVFAVCTDFSQEPRWRSSIVQANYLDESRDGGPGVGAKIQYVSRLLGKRIESTVRITTYEPSRLLAYETITGPIMIWGRDTYEPLDGKTRLTIHHQGKLKGVLRIVEPLLGKYAARAIRSDLQNLKEFIESGAYQKD